MFVKFTIPRLIIVFCLFFYTFPHVVYAYEALFLKNGPVLPGKIKSIFTEK